MGCRNAYSIHFRTRRNLKGIPMHSNSIQITSASHFILDLFPPSSSLFRQMIDLFSLMCSRTTSHKASIATRLAFEYLPPRLVCSLQYNRTFIESARRSALLNRHEGVHSIWWTSENVAAYNSIPHHITIGLTAFLQRPSSQWLLSGGNWSMLYSTWCWHCWIDD